jgi:outer membrane murein-binding lipoprotein Lpp
LDATTLGSLLVGLGAVVGAVVAYVGKRGENALTGYSSLTNDLQEERDRLDSKVTELNAKVAELSSLRAADQAEIARLRALIVHLGGEP